MIPVNEPLLNGNEEKYLIECIRTGWISSEGSFVKKFEEGMAKYIGKKYGIAVSSGTAALEIAVKALGIRNGDEVIMPAFTIISCAQAVVKTGARPVLVDCDYRTFNMKIDEIEKKITEKTKAIMVVHIYGLAVDMEPVINIANKYGLKIIEDASEAIGLKYKNKLCGSLGDISVFSFYANKHITTGEGGMILTDNEELAERCKSLRNLCFSSDPYKRFIHEELGWNYRMTNLQAAIGVAQLERIEQIVQKKRWIGETYNKFLQNLKSVYLPVKKTNYCENIYWVYPLVLKDDYPKMAKDVMEELKKYGIGTRPFFYPIHKQPVFIKMGLFSGDEYYPNSEKLYLKGFYIPSGLALTEDQIIKVADTLRRILI